MYINMTTNLMSRDVNKAIEFYQTILGFSLVTSVPAKTGGLQFAILKKDSIMLMLQEKSNFVEEYPVLAGGQPSVSLYIIVDDLAPLYESLQKYVCVTMHTTFYGKKEFAITDVDGYVLTFTEK